MATVMGIDLSSAGNVIATGNITGGNITTVGLVTATGNVTGGNILTAGLISSTGNVTSGNIATAGLITTTGNVIGGNLLTAGLISATSTITSAANITGGNITTAGLISATGNIFGSFYNGNGSLLTGIPLKTLGQQVIATSTPLTSSNYGTNILATVAGITITLPSTAPNGTVISISNLANGTVNLSYTGSSGTDGPTSLQYQQNIMLISDGGSPPFWRQYFGSPGYLPNGTGFVGTTFVSLTATGNVIGGNILTAGLMSSTGNITGGNLSVGTGTITVNNIVNGSTSATGNIGSGAVPFNTVFAKATSAQYADLAELYLADAEYAPGTVVSFGGEFEITESSVNGDVRVAGIVSTNPSYLMNSGLIGKNIVAVGLQGRLPCSVTGTVRKGDMLVSNGDGSARAEANPAVGTVIGKALDNFNDKIGIIEVVVGIR